VFDYFSVFTPANDYATFLDPQQWEWVDGSGNRNALAAPAPVANLDPTRPNLAEEHAGVEGLVNVNTAPWYVLAQLPLVLDPSTGRVDMAGNIEMAKYLTRIRSNYSKPVYRNLYELVDEMNRFRAQRWSMPQDTNDQVGDFSPYGPQSDGPLGRTYTFNNSSDPSNARTMPGEFERRWQDLIRLSNLITFRSDVFTVYVVIEGWTNSHSVQAERVVQRRAAFIVDRTNLSPTNRQPRVVQVPVN